MEPYEIIAAPFSLYLAPVGEAFPDVDEAPSGGWVLVGTNGSKNYSEDGVTVTHEQTIEEFRFLGSTGPLKASRTEEGLIVMMTLHDITLEQYIAALNFNSVSTTAAGAGTPGTKDANLFMGLTLAERALLVRGDGVSSYGAGWSMQYQVPRVVQRASPEVVYQKGEPAGLELEFMALVDLNATAGEEFGKLIVQNADPV